MNNNYKEVMTNKSDTDLLEIHSNYTKYTKDALIALISELTTRKIEIPNIIEIENWIKELEVKNENVGKVIGKIELHPNIERVSKLILLGIPMSVIQLIITAFYIHQAVGSISFSQILSMLSFALILIWIVIILFAAWIKSGTSTSRIVIGILTVYAVITNISSFIDTANEGILLVFVSIINLLIESYILYLLFNKDTSNWYKSNKQDLTTKA